MNRMVEPETLGQAMVSREFVFSRSFSLVNLHRSTVHFPVLWQFVYLGADLVVLLQFAEIGRDVLSRPFERDSSVREDCPEQGPVVAVRHCK